jgi:UDP-glucose 4-epimerase
LNILITGAGGFLGKALALYYKDRGHKVTGIGNKLDYILNNSEYFDKVIDGEISIEKLNQINEKLDLVIHCAGGSLVATSIKSPYIDFSKTVNSTAMLLEYLRLNSPGSKLIFISSAAVYGDKPDLKIHENSNIKPLSPYGFNKLICENLLESYFRNFGIKIAILRLFSLYGEGLKKQLLWDAANKLSIGGESLFYGTGNETRDWIHVDDVCEAVRLCATSNENFKIYNVGSGKRESNLSILRLLQDKLNCEGKIQFNGVSKEGDPRHYWSDNSSLRSIGWEPKVTLEDGIFKYARWFKGL